MSHALKKSDFNLICRTCLSHKSEMLSIKSLEQLKIVLIKYIGLKLEETMNTLPNLICMDCKEDLEKFIQFKDQCINSETVLLKILDTDETIYEETTAVKEEFDNLSIYGEKINKQDVKDEFDNSNKNCLNDIDNNRISSQENIDNFSDTDSDENFDNEDIKIGDQLFLFDKDIKNKQCGSPPLTDKENNDLITCKYCNKRIRHNTIKGHMRRHIQPKKHKCDQCSKAYREPNELAKHCIRVHNHKETVQCKVCNEVFSIQAQLDFHMKRHFKKKSVCDTCGKEFFNIAKLKRHKQSHETREKTIFCLLCDRMFARHSTLMIHNKKYHSGKPLMKKICNICGKSVLNIKTHTLQKHSTERPFKCTLCSKSYVIKSQLYNHIKSQHDNDVGGDDKKFTVLCSTCGKCCRSNADLKVHMISHTNEQLFQCHICEKKYKSAQGLKCHINKHNNLRPYSCTHCPKAFYTSQILKNHLRTHTGERPYECQLCGRAFSQSCALKTHMKIHGA
ncbi:oocyte zinc finger protein XlCOF6-like [Chrysoperla carnea]|uniref:oocyte zinc finger protein XlCOF6-like n=1 Tax=Chrysoperla carnea TaxID=189513 RepID=UPI001D06FFF0|nr:oocyte zinc finger protein XlCOF6-like [Chrysoperla carnea]